MAHKLRTTISSPIGQYSIGVLINLIYIAILISNQTSYRNIQLPLNNYAENLWKGTDVLTYVGPAQNFVDYRIFGSGYIPDYHRTIGYPLFLSVLMMVFGSRWLIFAFFVQAIIFASIYPLLSRTSILLLNSSNRAVSFAFLFFIFSGVYITRVPIILTDTFFVLLFTAGLWAGLEAIIKRNYMYLLAHIMFIGYAAQVRPVLSLYPIINCFVLVSVATRYECINSGRVHQMIIMSSVLLLVICNLPLIRNYINYNFLRPTDILSYDMLYNLGRNTLLDAGKEDEYEEIQRALEGVNDLNTRTHLQEELAIKIYKRYPLITLKQIIHNAIGILGRAHWPEAAFFWGYSFLDRVDPGHMPLKKSLVISSIEMFFNLVSLLVYFLFLSFLIRGFKSGNIVFPLAIVLFMTYFLIPTFIVRGAGSRYRLPVEGLIVIMASCEFAHYFERFNGMRCEI